MKKYLAFNFVELMLVMCVLGIIITLTLPLLKNIKDDDDIYRAYMKKANQDVTDALAMGLIKNRFLEDLGSLGSVSTRGLTASAYLNADKDLATRYLFNNAVLGKECGTTSGDGNQVIYTVDGSADVAQCLSNVTFNSMPVEVTNPTVPPTTTTVYNDIALDATTPGIVLSKVVMLFDDSVYDEDEDIYGYVYVDMNGNKSPNETCKDRYRFILRHDRVVLDETVPRTLNSDGTVAEFCTLEL